jgi:hypothetical protein
VFTSGLSHADFLWNYNGTKYAMEFVAGFVGFRQDAETLSLRPEINWAIVDKQRKPSPEALKAYMSPLNPPPTGHHDSFGCNSFTGSQSDRLSQWRRRAVPLGFCRRDALCHQP